VAASPCMAAAPLGSPHDRSQPGHCHALPRPWPTGAPPPNSPRSTISCCGWWVARYPRMPDGYGHGHGFLPAGTLAGGHRLGARVRWRAGKRCTRTYMTRCHPYTHTHFWDGGVDTLRLHLSCMWYLGSIYLVLRCYFSFHYHNNQIGRNTQSRDK
jgi:hypothetical protein